MTAYRIKLGLDFRRRAEHGFGEHSFKHKTQLVLGPRCVRYGERPQRVSLSLLFVRKSELTEFFAELTEVAAELSSEAVLSKQYSARFLDVFFTHCSEVSKRGWREGFGDKQNPQNRQEKFARNVSPFSYGGIGTRVQKRGLNLWHRKDFFATTPFCPPTPFRNF